MVHRSVTILAATPAAGSIFTHPIFVLTTLTSTSLRRTTRGLLLLSTAHQARPPSGSPSTSIVRTQVSSSASLGSTSSILPQPQTSSASSPRGANSEVVTGYPDPRTSPDGGQVRHLAHHRQSPVIRIAQHRYRRHQRSSHRYPPHHPAASPSRFRWASSQQSGATTH